MLAIGHAGCSVVDCIIQILTTWLESKSFYKEVLVSSILKQLAYE